MKWLGIVALMALSLSACGGSSDPFSDSCFAKIRYDGRLYVEVGFSNRNVSTAGKAAIATCARDADTKEVDAFSFPDYNGSKVLAVKQDGDVYRVFVEENQGETYIMSLHEDRLLNAGDD